MQVSGAVANSLLSMQAAVICSQCQPGQLVGMDNKIYDYYATTQRFNYTNNGLVFTGADYTLLPTGGSASSGPLFAGFVPPSWQFAKWAARNAGKVLRNGNPKTIPGAPNAPPEFPGDFQSELTKLEQGALEVLGDVMTGISDVFVMFSASPCINPELSYQLPSCHPGQNP
jgi:hypothetical protein